MRIKGKTETGDHSEERLPKRFLPYYIVLFRGALKRGRL